MIWKEHCLFPCYGRSLITFQKGMCNFNLSLCLTWFCLSQTEAHIPDSLLWLLGEVQVSLASGRQPDCSIWATQSTAGWHTVSAVSESAWWQHPAVPRADSRAPADRAASVSAGSCACRDEEDGNCWARWNSRWWLTWSLNIMSRLYAGECEANFHNLAWVRFHIH